MKRLPTTVIISFGLAALTLALLLAASSVGLLPDGRAALVEERTRFAELFAATCASAVSASDGKGIDELLQQVIAPNDGVARARVTDPAGKVLAEYHGAGGSSAGGGQNAVVSLAIPGEHGDAGRLELEFLGRGGPAGVARLLPGSPVVRLAVFVTSVGFVAYLLYLRVVLRHLDPSAVIPPRVRAMLNVMSEGIVILDGDGRIVMASDSFCTAAGLHPDTATGHLLSQLPWVGADGSPAPAALPWTQAIERGTVERGVPLGLMKVAPGEVGANAWGAGHRILMVNATAIVGAGGRVRGAVASFDDVTAVERTNELLRRSNAEVERANVELLRLATTDPLTGCLNRRSFFAKAEPALAAAREAGAPAATVMLDIDHFKSINDRFGHAVGDQVLVRVAEVVRAACGADVLPCRYGGEEFCMLLAGVTPEAAAVFGERLRTAIAAGPWEITPVTASVGVCSSEGPSQTVSDLLRHADEALYHSKRSGRNRVTVWDAGLAQPPSASPPTGPLPMPQNPTAHAA